VERLNALILKGTPTAKAPYYVITDVENAKAWGANRIRDPSSPRRKR